MGRGALSKSSNTPRHRLTFFEAYAHCLIVVVMAMTVIAFVPIFVMPIGVTTPMTVTMIFLAPGAFAIVPSMRAMLIMRTGPICAGIGRAHIVAGDPAIMLALRRPEATYPDERRFRRWWRHLITNRWGCYPDVDGDLRQRWCRESCCNNSESHTLFEHGAFPQK